MFDFIRKLFGRKKTVPVWQDRRSMPIPKRPAAPPPPPSSYPRSTRYTTRQEPVELDIDAGDGFTESLVAAQATDSALFGMAVGGNPAGALLGAALAAEPEPSSCRDEPMPERYEPSYSSSDSSSWYSDRSSSSDSGSCSSD